MNIKNKIKKGRITMVKIKLQKNGYNTFALWGPLAIETYCDINKISDEEKIVINKMYQKQKEYNDLVIMAKASKQAL